MKIVKNTPDLADALYEQLSAAKASRSWNVGEVTATSPLNVQVAGSDLGALAHAAGYTPAVGDFVIVLFSGQSAVVVDKIVS